MATLQGFLHPKKIDTLKFVLSDRFCDEGGAPLEWEIRAIDGDAITEIQNACMTVGEDGKTELNAGKFQKKLVAESVVIPNPNAADLQDAYGCVTPEGLFGKMLTAAEYLALSNKVNEVNGLNRNLTELVETAKN